MTTGFNPLSHVDAPAPHPVTEDQSYLDCKELRGRLKPVDTLQRSSLWMIFLSVLVGLVGTTAVAEPATLTPAEQFVLDKLRTTGEADFEESSLKDRTLRAQFLRKLILGAYTNPVISANGITISNASVRGELKVTDANIPFPLRFHKCTFDEGVDFEYDTFTHDLSLEKSKVGKPPTGPRAAASSSALFVGMKVDGTLNLEGTYFYSAVNFTYAEIGSEFLSDDVHYESEEVADFDSIKTKAPVFFRKDHFAGKLYLADSDLFSLRIEGIPLGPANPSDSSGAVSLQIDQARITHGFEIKDVALGSLEAGFVDVQGPMKFTNVVPLGHVDLGHSHFQSLTIKGFDPWLRKGSSDDFKLEGLSFDGIEIPGARVDPPAMKVLELLNSPRCPYSPQPYLELEKYLRSHGSPEKADQTYIDMRRRERAQLSPWKQPFDWMLDALVGYGRKPWKAGIYALLLILVGTAVFRPGCMEHDDEKCTDRWYSPLWFSLDLLSPIDLGVSKRWRARKPLVRNYAQIHRVAGWVLIPLIAAAITGIIK